MYSQRQWVTFALTLLTLLAPVLADVSATAPERQSIASLGGYYGFGTPLRLGSEVALKSEYTTLVFSADTRKCRVNDIWVYLHAGIVKSGNNWLITRTDAEHIIDPLLRPSTTVGGTDVVTIVLDPGHGGSDSGAIGHRQIYEKKATYDIARRTQRKLEAAGLKVRLTREGDRYVSLPDRSARAGRWGGDLFVSIHLNAASNLSVSGIETYVLSSPGFASTLSNRPDRRSYPGNRFNKQNTLLGYYCHRALVEQTGSNDRGLRRARFDVLRRAPCPAVLIEGGFISNPSEAEKILERGYRDRIAQGIAKGIACYVAKSRP